ncbi:hypothetical protein P3S67_011102 [Capsicum chacoense]
MGLSTVPSLASKLIHHRLPADTPAVAVEQGITPQQRMLPLRINHLCFGICKSEIGTTIRAYVFRERMFT